MATIYYWSPDPYTRAVGHVSMELHKERIYISHWPGENKIGAFFASPLGKSSSLDEDEKKEGRKYTEKIVIPGSMINHDKIAHWYKNDYPQSVHSLRT